MTPTDPDGRQDDEESALLRADYLMRRRERPAAPGEGGQGPAPEEDFIPTLTDLVRLGYRSAVAPPPAGAPLPAVAEPAHPHTPAGGLSMAPAATPGHTLPDIFDPTLAPPADEAAPGIDFVLDEPLPAIPAAAEDPLALPIEPAPPLWVAPRMDALPEVDIPPAEPLLPATALAAETPAEPAAAPEATHTSAEPDRLADTRPAAVSAPLLQPRPGHVRAILERRLRAELSELVDHALAEVSLELQARMGRILRETLDEAETDARADADPEHGATPR